MDANDLFGDFESQLRSQLTSIELFKMRPANSDLLISFRDTADFLAAVRSASGVNIALEIGWLFEPKQSDNRGIDQCFLRFQLSDGCDDERLSWFLKDLVLGTSRP